MGPITTKDLELDQEQKDVGIAVDMEFARRAAVFIGNGVSPFFISDDCEIAADLIVFSGLRLRVILYTDVWLMAKSQ